MKLLENLSYDPVSGDFRWIVHRGTRKAGALAGNPSTVDGYIRIQIDGRVYLAHRLAWLAIHGQLPVGLLDHKNGKRHDNRISNLRLATRAQNTQNSVARSNSGSGLKGVSFHKTQKQWRARIRLDGKLVLLGWFDTPQAAHAAYCVAAMKHFGEFFNSGEMTS